MSTARLSILHVMDGVSADYGGPAAALLHLAAAQGASGHDVTLLLRRAPAREGPTGELIRSVGGLDLVRVAATGEGADLGVLLSASSVVHVHGTWERLGTRAAWACRRAGIPYVMRPAGMLAPWCLNRKRLKKALALALVVRRLLDGAAFLHATGDREAADLKRLGLRPPVAVVPLGVDAAALARAAGDAADTWPELRGTRILLYLSRVHPVKGLGLLAAAWGRLAPRWPEWRLVIAGPDEQGERGRTEAALEAAGVRDRVTFTGAVHGPRKHALLRSAEAFVLPTLSESFGIAVAEALAAGLPVVTTTAAPWERIVPAGCGWVVEPDVEPLREALESVLASPAETLRAMGERGRRLVEDEHGWRSVAALLDEHYARALAARDGRRTGAPA